MSDTPRTDALWKNDRYAAMSADNKIATWADFARDMEREFSKLKRKYANLNKVCRQFKHALTVFKNTGQWPEGVDVESFRVATAEAGKGGAS